MAPRVRPSMFVNKRSSSDSNLNAHQSKLTQAWNDFTRCGLSLT